MSSAGEKASEEVFRLDESPQPSKGKDDESMQQIQSTKPIHESGAQRLQEEGESARGKTPRTPVAHDTKPQPSSSEQLLGEHATLSTDTPEDETPRKVIAVSASRGPATFFNLARKFLVTDEMCDLQALEGAISSAVDAAHLLERSQLATIARVQTSYVTVEPTRKKVIQMQTSQEENLKPASETIVTTYVSTDSPTVEKFAPSQSSEAQNQAKNPPPQKPQITPPAQRSAPGGRGLRRARIVITVKRTEKYKQWLLENPLEATVATSTTADTDVEEAGS